MGIFTSLFGFLGSLIGFKKAQGEVIQTTVKALDKIAEAESSELSSQSKIISTEASSGFWLTANWRPLLMTTFGFLIVLRWFGFAPPNMSEVEVLKVYSLMELGIGGYVIGRSAEKIVSALNLGSVIKSYVDKKVF